MKKQLKVACILLILTLTIIELNFTLFPPVKATYVEGPIDRDTVWTLVDSPFVISNETIVHPNVTLTIEPGVEVRFGGNFSIKIQGILNANGTTDKPIKFTSNKEEPHPGDWGSIIFNNSQPLQQSTLTKCTIEYGINGISLENGQLKIQDCTIQFNSENGTQIINGFIEIKNSTIAANTHGISISGGNQIIIQNNNITSNENGISLLGNLTETTLNIQKNNISLNTNAGILLAQEDYNNTYIQDNYLTQNANGFYVTTNTSTLITRNYIINNTIGIYYQNGEKHEAHFNDIYENTLGMDVANATVDATYNYWGDQSGPYHISLNPKGKGNPVGGNGINLNFIFFLTKPIDYNNTAPTAVLWTDIILAAPNQTITFIGTNSYDDCQIDQYFYDFGDGNQTRWTTLSLFTHKYTSTGNYTAKLKVKDDFGVESQEKTTTITVQNLTPLNVQITLNKTILDLNENVLVTIYVTNGTHPVENATITLFSIKDGNFTPSTGLTNSTGYFTTTFTPHNTTELTDIRLIARATKSGYADGADHKYVKVLPPMIVEVHSQPATIKSEENATITVHAKDYFSNPLSNVSLSITSDYGTILPLTSQTNINGTATFNFTAPQTTEENGINITITVTANKEFYSQGIGHTTIWVQPKILTLQITATTNTTLTYSQVEITANVTYETLPIEDAYITITSPHDEVNLTATTDFMGITKLNYTTPPVNQETNITLTASVTKEGYLGPSKTITITVNPRTFNIQITTYPAESQEPTTIEVLITCKEDGSKVANATVQISSTHGSFQENTATTNQEGYCSFTFHPPYTTMELSANITVQANKEGYLTETQQTTIMVAPEAEGWPLTWILMIIIPIVIVAIVVLLIKMGIISISTEEELEE